jgi:hypothetical protein
MEQRFQDFVTKYAAMREDELIGLAHSYDSLVEAAQTALRAEFANRGLAPPILEEKGQEDLVEQALVTVRRYRDLSEAIVARTLLESAGIRVYLRDENLVRLDWQVSNFIGGIRLQVEGADQEAAIEILSQSIPPSIPFDDETDFFQPRCPCCGSIDIAFEGASRGAALASVHFLSIPLPFGRETWLCNSCESRWESDEE